MKIVDLIKISRPLGWPVLPAVFYMGLITSGGQASIPAIIIMIFLSFPICLAGYGINDVYDYESDRINPRKKSVEGHIVYKKDRKFVKKISLAMLSAFFLSTLLMGNLSTTFLAVIFIFLAYYYSALPIRLKERPPLDSLSNGFVYFFLPFALGFSLSKSLYEIPIKFLWITMCVTAIHSVSTMMDFRVDKKVGDKTFAIKFGQRNTAAFAFMVFLLTLLLSQFSFIFQTYLILCIILTFLLILFPTERFSKIVFKLIFIGFLISVFLSFLIK